MPYNHIHPETKHSNRYIYLLVYTLQDYLYFFITAARYARAHDTRNVSTLQHIWSIKTKRRRVFVVVDGWAHYLTGRRLKRRTKSMLVMDGTRRVLPPPPAGYKRNRMRHKTRTHKCTNTHTHRST